jgi:spore coat polysaccharide biosynthesis protein SpsF
MSKSTLIVQARMGSKRLPGKMLMNLGGKTLIANIISEVKKINIIDKIIIAIPKNRNNKILKSEIRSNKISVFEGSEENLVDRYFKAAKKYKSETIIRIPGDNCFPIAKEIRRIFIHYKKKGEEYFCSNLTPFHNSNYPDGIGAEVFSFKKLQNLKNKNLNKKKREHLHLNFIDYKKGTAVDNKFCKISTIKFNSLLKTKKVKLDINHLSDYLLMDKIYKELNFTKSKSINDILKIYEKNSNMKLWLKKNLD